MGALSRLGYNRSAWAETNVPMTTKPDTKTLRQQIRYVKATDGTELAWAQSGQGPMLVKAANLRRLNVRRRMPGSASAVSSPATPRRAAPSTAPGGQPPSPGPG